MPNDKIDAFLGELKRLDEAATPGPWMYSDILDNGGGGVVTERNEIVVGGISHASSQRCFNMAAIAAARNAIPKLVEMLEYILHDCFVPCDDDPTNEKGICVVDPAELEPILNGETE